jgi:hypothetical protein
MREFCLFIPVGFQEFFYMPSNLMTWDLPALLPIRDEGVQQIFIALKNPSPWLGSNLQLLGPVANTLMTTPPRRPPYDALKKSMFVTSARFFAFSVSVGSVILYICGTYLEKNIVFL